MLKDFLRNRTNNPLERKNREFNKLFGTHPDLLKFLSVIKEDASENVKLVEDVQNGIAKPPAHAGVVEVEIPKAFKDFKFKK